jgi:flagellar biosynthesis/type III secretory pathway M-ring protein FliF/YscJ
MKKNFNLNAQQKKSILYAVICGGIVLIIILVGILPYSFKVSNQQKENEKLASQIKEQRELGPVYKT